jgi:hypothetical protein
MNYSLQIILGKVKYAGRLCSLRHKYNKKITVGIGFLLMYAGFILLLLPMMISAWPLSLTLSSTPQFFGFEDDLNSVHSTHGNPIVVTSPSASGKKAVECQNGDYVSWDLMTPSKTLDLTFRVFWTKLPTIANESLSFVQIFGLDSGKWQDISTASFYCTPDGYRGGNLWTDVPSGRGGFVAGDVVDALETDRWYAVRMTVDLNMGTYRLYIDGNELASISDVKVPEKVNIDFFMLGANAKGDGNFITYFDDVAVSLLDPTPPSNQWSLRVTSSSGGSAEPIGTVNLNNGENLTVNATPIEGYVLGKWTFDGADYGTGSTVTVSAQPAGTQHTLHATFIGAVPESHPEYKWVPLQLIGLIMIGSGGYLLWSKSKSREI